MFISESQLFDLTALLVVGKGQVTALQSFSFSFWNIDTDHKE